MAVCSFGPSSVMGSGMVSVFRLGVAFIHDPVVPTLHRPHQQHPACPWCQAHAGSAQSC